MCVEFQIVSSSSLRLGGRRKPMTDSVTQNNLKVHRVFKFSSPAYIQQNH